MLIVNPRTNAVSTHSADVSHVVEHDGVLYGSAGESLVSFDGEPEGVTLGFGELKLAGGQLARVPYATVSAQAGGVVTLSLSQNIKGRSKTLGPYSVARVAGEEERQYRVKLGGGHQGNACAITVNAVGRCKLSGIDLDVRAGRGDN